MLNVPELERRWKKYRIKQHFPLMTFASILVIITGIILVATLSETKYDKKKQITSAINATVSPRSSSSSIKATISTEIETPSQKTRTAITEQPVVQHSIKSNVSSKSIHSSIENPSKDLSSVKLHPSMAFMQNIENDVLDYYFQDNVASSSLSSSSLPSANNDKQPRLPSIDNSTHTTVIATKSDTIVSAIPVSNLEKPNSKSTSSASTAHMSIQRENDMKDIQHVIKRFKKNKNPALSLFVAKRYYKIGNYQQAYNYALITNDLDNNIEDSWLIFAKSLYHLNQKDMAKKTLRTYLIDSGSVKAKITLEQMEDGSFK
ncbi:MAG TPA: hypothetical protein ENL02_02830 [Epsilonproteobacteria bacterium]|nr:hypothetical protein [Campylobacterota bacterium]